MNIANLILYGYSDNQACSITLVCCLFFFIFCLNIGPSPLSWEITSEFVPLEYRSGSQALVCASNSFTTFIGILLFPIGQRALGQWLFGLLSIPVAVGGLFLYFFMPETKGTTPFQIQKIFSGSWMDIYKNRRVK